MRISDWSSDVCSSDLMSDDLGMHALTGGFDERAQGVVAAGCDAALHCSGDMAEMVAVAKGLGEMTDAALKRLDRAKASVAVAAQAASYDELPAQRTAPLAFC